MLRHRSLHDERHRAILGPGQIKKIVLNILEPAELTGPSAIGQLARGMSRNSLIVGENCDLLEAGFQLGVRASDVAQRCKSGLEGQDGFSFRNSNRPVISRQIAGPPPLRSTCRGPSDTVKRSSMPVTIRSRSPLPNAAKLATSWQCSRGHSARQDRPPRFSARPKPKAWVVPPGRGA